MMTYWWFLTCLGSAGRFLWGSIEWRTTFRPALWRCLRFPLPCLWLVKISENSSIDIISANSKTSSIAFVLLARAAKYGHRWPRKRDHPIMFWIRSRVLPNMASVDVEMHAHSLLWRGIDDYVWFLRTCHQIWLALTGNNRFPGQRTCGVIML